MEWQQLEYFQKVAQVEHFTRAAEELFISQPALSRSIARLEKDLGVPLFERSGRTVKLNRYGRMFLSRVNESLQLIEDGKQELTDIVHPDHGQIALSFLHTLGSHLVPDLIGQYRKTFPHVKFQLFQSTADVLIEQLTTGEVDLCLTSAPVQTVGFHWEKLFSEKLYIIVPKSHRLAARKGIKLEEIANEPFIGFKEGVGLRTITDQLCQDAGFTPNITFEGQEVSTVNGLVSAGLGVSLIPERKGLDETEVSKIEVLDYECTRSIGIAWVESRYIPQVVQQFKDFISGQFKK
ncbi:LysR family transcriptional regulator [Alkalihalobacterium chitinilyticum]|uniref:LysR family transcriptional regulator n=1 Tax=Alkalihalobacterium chitinilyticum TaxID=2980103 RepID=A0ABT5VLA9_9BACI|nr:LysR family transcriptional regulator [Alkalihalobacterium chitinilyticum]MDE5416225.1 LysR family transcriptional regulator [Alkalihalobacterium chitinilyticum]